MTSIWQKKKKHWGYAWELGVVRAHKTHRSLSLRPDTTHYAEHSKYYALYAYRPPLSATAAFYIIREKYPPYYRHHRIRRCKHEHSKSFVSKTHRTILLRLGGILATEGRSRYTWIIQPANDIEWIEGKIAGYNDMKHTNQNQHGIAAPLHLNVL